MWCTTLKIALAKTKRVKGIKMNTERKMAIFFAAGLLVGSFAITAYAYASYERNGKFLASSGNELVSIAGNEIVSIAGREYALKTNKEELMREFGLTEGDIELRVNESGQTYGPSFYAPEPDLFRVGLPDGRSGYCYSKEFAPIEGLQERIQHMEYLDSLMQAEKLMNPEAAQVVVKDIPVYESDGKTIIGSFPITYAPAEYVNP